MDGFQKRTLKKKKAILDAAFLLFNQYGYKNVTIANISKHAHVSLETIYNYFQSKERLKKELLNQIISDFCISTEEMLKSNIPVHDKFEKLLLAKVDFGKKFSPEFLSDELNELNDLDLFAGEDMKQLLHDIMMQIIGQGRAGNIITVDVSSEAISTYINIFQFYITHDFASALKLSNKADLLQEVNYLFFNGMKAK